MPTRVTFVAQVGRVSAGAATALPKIESICAKFGGKVVGGVGSSTDPILAEFAEKPAAVAAAQEAWYLDDVEFAKVQGADANAAGAVSESAEGSEAVVVEGVSSAIDAVVSGQDAKTAVDSLIEAKKKACKEKGDKEKGEKDDDKGGDKK